VAPKRKAEEEGGQDDRAEAERPAKGARTTELKVPEAKAGWKQEEGKKREAALIAWEKILSADPSATELGRQLAEAGDETEAADTLNFSFQDKATATIIKRLCSISLFARWARAAGEDGPLPKTEGAVYRYVRALQTERAPATRAQSFIESVRFASGLANAVVPAKTLLSARVLGATLASASRKRLLTQTLPFSVQTVVEMERVVATTAAPVEAVTLGAFLFMLHARVRYTDLVRVRREPVLDICAGAGFVETQAISDDLKSGQGRNRRRRQVPLVGLAFGVSGAPWAQAWLRARKEAGLSAEEDGTLVPARSANGWSKASADIGEANSVLRGFLLRLGVQGPDARRHSTHSCKATLLSWASKHGMRGELRRLLGGHAKPKERMVLEYSRDALAPALHALTLLLADIRVGRFSPDADRSGRFGAFPSVAFDKQPSEDEAARDAPDEVGSIASFPEDGAESSAHSPSSSASSDEAVGDGGENAEEEVPGELLEEGLVPEAERDQVDTALCGVRALFVHDRLRTLHAAKLDDDGSALRLFCGLQKERTSLVSDISSTDFTFACARCFSACE